VAKDHRVTTYETSIFSHIKIQNAPKMSRYSPHKKISFRLVFAIHCMRSRYLQQIGMLLYNLHSSIVFGLVVIVSKHLYSTERT